MLSHLLDEFWTWTAISSDMWWRIDICELKIDTTAFPKYGELRDAAIRCINHAHTPCDIHLFLMAMAINAEDEDILDLCKAKGTNQFIQQLVQIGVNFPQVETRWQVAELLHREIPGREIMLKRLCVDKNEYVRRRARYILENISKSST